MSNVVPVLLPDMYFGLGECHGLIRDEGDHLCLEYQVRDKLLGALRTGVRTARLPLAELMSVTLESGWFGFGARKIIIRAAHLEAVQAVPGMREGRIELRVDRKDRAAAEKFVADLHVADEPAGGAANPS